MAPSIPIGSIFSPDALDLIRCLNQHQVRYLVVGGGAVILHGHARMTGDMDFFYDLAAPNPQKLFDALSAFWGTAVPGITSAGELSEIGIITQFGRPPNRIDLINQIDGISFEEAWADHVAVEVHAGNESLPVPFIGKKALIRNKESSGRPKDLDDLRYLSENQ